MYLVGEGAGSIIAGIGRVKPFNVSVTERSYNLRKEFLSYVWGKDKDGNCISRSTNAWDHGIDITRYWVLAALLGKIQKPKSDITAAFVK